MDPDWGYGEGAESGAMIGYVQTMSANDILKEVNGYAKKIKVPALERASGGWVDHGVTRLDQSFDREVRPSPFRLLHLWVDLRHRYSTCVGVIQGPLSGQ